MAYRKIFSFPKNHPVAFGLAFSCVKTSFADYLVQKHLERRQEIDIPRNLAFGIFGLFYLGGVQYAIYVPGFRRLFPLAESFARKAFRDKLKDKKGIFQMFAQVVIDQCIHHPLLYFPTFYAVKTVIQGGDLKDAFETYRTNIKSDMVALWKIWVPATIFNFTFSPMWLRIPVVATTSLLWTCILSAMRGASEIELDPRTRDDAIGNQGRALERAWHRRESALDPTKTHVLLMASGPDRIGIVRDIAKVVAENGGGIDTSKMMRMAGTFSVMMLITADQDQYTPLVENLVAIEGMQVTTRTAHVGNEGSSSFAALAEEPVKFKSVVRLHGPDRPGLISELSHWLAGAHLNVEDMMIETTESLTNKQELIAEAIVTSSRLVDIPDLHKQLKELSKRLQVSVQLQGPRALSLISSPSSPSPSPSSSSSSSPSSSASSSSSS